MQAPTVLQQCQSRSLRNAGALITKLAWGPPGCSHTPFHFFTQQPTTLQSTSRVISFLPNPSLRDGEPYPLLYFSLQHEEIVVNTQ